MFKKVLFLITALFLFLTIITSAVAGTLKDIKEGRKVIVGVKYDFPPFGYLDDSGDLKGFDVLVANYIAKKMGVVPEFKKVTSKNRINVLLRGDVDIIIASMTKTPYRAKMINFTNSYFVDGQGILTNMMNLINDEKDLENKIVAVIMGSTGERYIMSSSVNFKALSLFKEYTDAVEALKEGKVDAIVTDLSWCLTQQKDSGGTLIAVEKTLTTEPFGIAVRKEDSDLFNRINELILEMWKDGSYKKMYSAIFDRAPDFDIIELSTQ